MKYIKSVERYIKTSTSQLYMTAEMMAPSNEFHCHSVRTQQPENKEWKKGKLAPERRRFKLKYFLLRTDVPYCNSFY